MTEASHGILRRRGMRAATAMAGAMAGLLGVGGCGIQPTGLRVVGSAPSLQPANDMTGDGAGTGSNQYSLYFFRNGKLMPVVRYTDETVTSELVLAALIKGPSGSDQSQGYSSVIPTSLSVVSTTALNQQWNYQYSLPLSIAEKAQIVCTVQADLGAPSVGTVTSQQSWNSCSDFSEDYGAVLPTVDSGSPSPGFSGDSVG